MTPDQYCQDKAAPAAPASTTASSSCRTDKRRAITALYAFCREVDDVVDECSDENVARTTLDWWRGQVAEIYGGKPQHPVGAGAGAAGAAIQPAAGTPAGNHRRHGDGSDPAQLCRFQVAAALLLPRRLGGRPAGGGNLRLHRPQDAEVRARPRHRLPAHQHHPRRGRRRTARPHLPAAGRDGAIRRAHAATSSMRAKPKTSTS